MRKAIMITCVATAGVAFASQALAAPVAKPASFAVCGVCHAVEKGKPSSLGPNLHGVTTRTAGTYPGFAYSAAMKKAGFKWDSARLTAFISNPRATVPGTRMLFAGVKDPKKVAEIADYIASLK